MIKPSYRTFLLNLPCLMAAGLCLGLLGACLPSTPSFVNVSTVRLASSQLEGQLILPYRVQQAESLDAFATDGFTSPAALNRLDLDALRARVDGSDIAIEILGVTLDPDQTRVKYRIVNLPAFDFNKTHTVEVLTGDGLPLLGGVVRLQPGRRVRYDLDASSTALLARLQAAYDPVRIAALTPAELRAFDLEPLLNDEATAIRAALRRDGTLRRHTIWIQSFDDDN